MTCSPRCPGSIVVIGHLPRVLADWEGPEFHHARDWGQLHSFKSWRALVVTDAAPTPRPPVFRNIERMARSGRMVLVVADQQAARRLVSWLRRVPEAEVVLGEELAARLRRIDERLQRPEVDPGRVVPHADPLDARSRAVLGALRRASPAYSPRAWAREVDWPYRRLVHHCRAAYRASPRVIVQRYVAAAAVDLRASGLSWDRIALVLGYADGAALQRAMRRARADPARRPCGPGRGSR